MERSRRVSHATTFRANQLNRPRDLSHSLLAQRRVLPVIYSQTYTLDTVVQGLDDLEKRKTWGKAIVRVRESPANERAKL